jgi:YD repeat-containing protein
MDCKTKTFTITDPYGVIEVYDLFTWNLLSCTFSDGETWKYTYDENGYRLTEYYDKNGNIL